MEKTTIFHASINTRPPYARTLGRYYSNLSHLQLGSDIHEGGLTIGLHQPPILFALLPLLLSPSQFLRLHYNLYF